MTDPSPRTPAPPPPDYEARREQLFAQWREQRRRRDSAPLGGAEFRAAAEEIGRLEIEIARLDRSVGRV